MKPFRGSVRSMLSGTPLVLVVLVLSACSSGSDGGGGAPADSTIVDDVPGPGASAQEPGPEISLEDPASGTSPAEPAPETPPEAPATGTPPAEPAPETPPAEPDPSAAVITVENSGAFLANLLDVVDGSVFEEFNALGDALLNAEADRVALVSSELGDQLDFEIRTYGCVGGGTYAVQISSSNAVGQILNGTATDCVVGEGELDGFLSRSGALSSSLQSFSLTRPSGAVTRADTSRRTIGRDPFDEIISESGSFEVSRYTDGSVSIDAKTELSHVDLTAAGEAPPGESAQNFYARFTAMVTAPWTDGQRLDVATTTGFAAQLGEPHYPVGTLVAQAADGSTLTLEADNGDPDTFQLTVETQGTSSAFTLPWSDGTRLPLATPP